MASHTKLHRTTDPHRSSIPSDLNTQNPVNNRPSMAPKYHSKSQTELQPISGLHYRNHPHLTTRMPIRHTTQTDKRLICSESHHITNVTHNNEHTPNTATTKIEPLQRGFSCLNDGHKPIAISHLPPWG